MKNYVQAGNILTLTAPAGGVTAGVGYVIGANTFAVALQSAAATLPFDGATEGVFTLPKINTATAAQGARVWFNNTTKEVAFSSSAGLFMIGSLTAAAVNGVTTCTVKLDGISVAAA